VIEGSWLTAALAVWAPILTAASINVLHTHQSGVKLRWRHAWVGFAILMTAPLVMLWILTRREVMWRGRRYSLNAGARLSESLSASAPIGGTTAAPGRH
jgi:hypothetical protein